MMLDLSHNAYNERVSACGMVAVLQLHPLLHHKVDLNFMTVPDEILQITFVSIVCPFLSGQTRTATPLTRCTREDLVLRSHGRRLPKSLVHNIAGIFQCSIWTRHVQILLQSCDTLPYMVRPLG
jgi:hypothetical protein